MQVNPSPEIEQPKRKPQTQDDTSIAEDVADGCLETVFHGCMDGCVLAVPRAIWWVVRGIFGFIENIFD